MTVGLIADGIHSHPASLRPAVRPKGSKRIWLLTELTALSADVARGDYGPAEVADEVLGAVQSRIGEQIAAFDRLLADELPAFNTRLAEPKLDAVLVI